MIRPRTRLARFLIALRLAILCGRRAARFGWRAGLSGSGPEDVTFRASGAGGSGRPGWSQMVISADRPLVARVWGAGGSGGRGNAA